MGVYNKKDSLLILELKRPELIYDIENLGFIIHDSADRKSATDEKNVVDINQDGNADRISRLLDLAYADVLRFLAGYIDRTVEVDAYGNDILNEPTSYYIMLTLHSQMPGTVENVLRTYIHEYMVAKVMYEWLSITAPAQADVWATKMTTLEGSIKGCMCYRKGGVQIKPAPWQNMPTSRTSSSSQVQPIPTPTPTPPPAPTTKYRDRGVWNQDTAINNPYICDDTVVDSVYYMGCKWRCQQNKTTETPTFSSTDWLFLEGNPYFMLSMESSNGWVFTTAEITQRYSSGLYKPFTTLSLKGMLYNQDATSSLTKISWSRDSGDATADKTWAKSKESAGTSIDITYEDLGTKAYKVGKVTFKCSAEIKDGSTIYADITSVTF